MSKGHILISALILAFSWLSVAAQHADDSFIYPEIPGNIVSPTDRAEYLAEHYWDNAEFSTLNYPDSYDYFEQAFVNFLSVLDLNSPATQASAMEVLVNSAAPYPHAMRLLDEIGEMYLFEFDSPMRNDDIYLIYAQSMLQHSQGDMAMQLRIKNNMNVVGSNMPGEAAPNFTYIDGNGKKRKLLDMRKPLLLLFYDPTCEDCEEAIRAIKSNEDLLTLVASNHLAIIAIDVDGTEVNTSAGLPACTYGIIEDDSIIDVMFPLRGIPSIFLINADGSIAAKEVDPFALPLDEFDDIDEIL